MKNTFVRIIIAQVATIALVWGINHSKLLHSYDTYYGIMPTIDGLQEAGLVYLHGVKIGKVTDMFLDSNQHIHLTYDIKKGTHIPGGAVAKVIKSDVAGTKSIDLIIYHDSTTLTPGTYIPSFVDTSFFSSINTQLAPAIASGKFFITATDSILSDIHQSITTGGKGNEIRNQLTQASQQLQKSNKQSYSLLQKVQSFGTSIEKINALFAAPHQMNNNINEKITSGTQTMKDLSVVNYDSTLSATAGSVTKLSQTIVQKTAAMKLLHDTTTYHSINRKAAAADTSMRALQADPPGLQLIGSGKKKK